VIQNLNEDLAKSFSYKSKTGALVGDVEEGSPAFKAGIKSGDIITKLNGNTVKDVNNLRNEIGSIAPNTAVVLTLFSEGSEKDVKVTLSELKEDQQESINEQDPAGELGLVVSDLTPEIAASNNLKTKGKVFVVNIDPYGIAAEAGIQRGDVILKVVKQEVNSAKEFEKLAKAADLSQGIVLVVETKGSSRYISLRKSE
jgi:serine protease Do